MKEFSKYISELAEKVVSEKAESIVEKTIEGAIENVFDQLFGKWNSDFSKQLQEAISSKLEVSLDNLDLSTYTSFINAKIEERVNGSMLENILPGLDKTLDKIVGKLKPQYTLSELVEIFKQEQDANDYDFYSGSENQISFYCELNRRSQYYEISIDHRADVLDKDCEIIFMVQANTGENTPSMFVISMQTEWSQGIHPEHPINVAHFTNFQMLLFKIKNSQNTKVIVDYNNVDTNY